MLILPNEIPAYVDWRFCPRVGGARAVFAAAACNAVPAARLRLFYARLAEHPPMAWSKPAVWPDLAQLPGRARYFAPRKGGRDRNALDVPAAVDLAYRGAFPAVGTPP